MIIGLRLLTHYRVTVPVLLYDIAKLGPPE